MKILLLGYYDFAFGMRAAEFENGKLKPIELEHDSLFWAYSYKDHWYKEEAGKKTKKKIRELFSKYDHVLVCEDSEWKQLK